MSAKTLEHEDARSYSETLEDLTFNSRPHIVTLTELARDYGKRIPRLIVDIIERRIAKANTTHKLPTLYLMDSIIKNHPNPYKPLFQQNLPSTFANVFICAKEDIRSALFKLRSTWTPLFSSEVLYNLDLKIKKIDPAWPIVEKSKNSSSSAPKIHVNPNFFEKQKSVEKDDDIKKMEEENKRLKRLLLEKENEALKEKLKQQVESKSKERSSGTSTKKSSKDHPTEKVSSAGTRRSNSPPPKKIKEIRDPRSKSNKSHSNLPPELAKILDVKPQEISKQERPKSRSPSRQSPTSTSTEKSSTPPPPPSIRNDFKKSKKAKKAADKIQEPKGNFRIPKKSNNKRSPSPNTNRSPPKKAKIEPKQRPQPWQNNFGTSQQMFGQHFNDKSDPEAILTQIVPMLVAQNQKELAGNILSPEQFSENMKQITKLREWAMIQKAENKENGRGNFVKIPQNSRDLPMADPADLEFVANNPVKSMEIDRMDRLIRFYGEQGTILMTESDGRHALYDLSFTVLPQEPECRNVYIDNDLTVSVPVNSAEYTEFRLEDGLLHKIKIGAPTRELWIDGVWYSLYFDNAIDVYLSGKMRSFYLEGPPPSVDIGRVERKDLCAGTVQLLIDGDVHNSHLMFLDEQPQQIDIGGKPHIFKFVEHFCTLLINGHPFKAEFGRSPMVVHVNQVKHYLRLTALPRGVQIGVPLPSREQVFAEFENHETLENPVQPPVDEDSNQHEGTHLDHFMNNVMSSPAVQAKPEKTAENSEKPAENPVDVQKLLASLVGAGLIKKTNENSIPGLDSPVVEKVEKKVENEAKIDIPEEKKEEPKRPKIDWQIHSTIKKIRPVVLMTRDPSIKERQEAIIERIFDPRALQCKICGIRYCPNDNVAYSKHLDWHFRMKKRDKENLKRAQSRKWYLEKSNWIISNEIEDTIDEPIEEDHVKEAEVEIPSVPANKDPEMNKCPVCFEDFEQFFKEEDGEDGGQWHLKNAILDPNGQAYHPQCYEDRGNVGMEFEEEKSEADVSMEIKPEPEEPESKATESEKMEEEKPENPVKSEPMETNEAETEVKEEAEEVSKGESENVPEIKVEAPENENSEEKNSEDSEETKENEEVKDEPLKDLDQSLENLTADAGVTAPPSFNLANIKINITSQSSAPGSPSKEEKVEDEKVEKTEENVKKEEESEYDVDCIIQEKSKEEEEDPFRHKPRLKGRKLVEIPKTEKGSDLSGLCSIM